MDVGKMKAATLSFKTPTPTSQKNYIKAKPRSQAFFKALREALGLTQAALAKNLKISKRLVRYWETGIGTFFPCQFHVESL